MTAVLGCVDPLMNFSITVVCTPSPTAKGLYSCCGCGTGAETYCLVARVGGGLAAFGIGGGVGKALTSFGV